MKQGLKDQSFSRLKERNRHQCRRLLAHYATGFGTKKGVRKEGRNIEKKVSLLPLLYYQIKHIPFFAQWHPLFFYYNSGITILSQSHSFCQQMDSAMVVRHNGRRFYAAARSQAAVSSRSQSPSASDRLTEVRPE